MAPPSCGLAALCDKGVAIMATPLQFLRVVRGLHHTTHLGRSLALISARSAHPNASQAYRISKVINRQLPAVMWCLCSSCSWPTHKLEIDQTNHRCQSEAVAAIAGNDWQLTGGVVYSAAHKPGGAARR